MSSSQMLKGILEGCLLSIISEKETYGYEMMQILGDCGFTMVSEGSIYPLLIRLKKEGLVETNSKPLPSGGPKRKYYTLTEKGKEELETFKKNWNAISNGVIQLLEREGETNEGI
ncbi:PadR family transcriptional regulator [Radiobacillus deserti]|uniref:PadR family transcriptional regulator n=1 Tax=Radiobacillus deserti TaxID=2594883 RepID=A0A516KEW1_9BACI|nr:PadR family transcriptional regulator [Radiobacillus deserti]QDP39856.1 PadR family transcriptional regulator [Radiobacillus deserti]